MDVHKGVEVAVISTNLGGVDRKRPIFPQSMPFDLKYITDSELPPRDKAMTSRLQSKIPKFFGWQLAPGYKYYLWIDGSLEIWHSKTVEYFYENCQGYDIVVWRHPSRPNIRQEARYLRKGLREQSIYLVSRYAGEWTPEQVEEFSNVDFIDDLLAIGGIFMYRDCPEMRAFMKEWWYYTTRYSVFDQLSFAFLLKTSGVKVKVLEDNLYSQMYVKNHNHRIRNK